MFSYEIKPRTDDLGGGWRLHLLENGVEMGGGVFPPVEGIEDAEQAKQAAYNDALEEACHWLETRA